MAPRHARWLMGAGSLAHLAATIVRGALIAYFPLTNKLESFSFAALTLAIVAVVSWRPVRLYVVPLAALSALTLAVALRFSHALVDAPSLMRTIWYPLHIPASFFAYAVWAAAAAAADRFCLGAGRLRRYFVFLWQVEPWLGLSGRTLPAGTRCCARRGWVVCGFAVVLLLALGSVVMAATRDGAAAGIALDDIRPFFEKPSPWHLWFCLLLLVCLVYALNVTLCTWHSVVDKWRLGLRRPAAYGTALIHVALPVALLTVAGRPCRAEVDGAACTAGRWSVALTEMIPAGQFGPYPLARVRAWRSDAAPRDLWLITGRATALDDSVQLSVEGFEERPAIVLRGRRAPGNPLAVLSALLLGSGLLLIGRRFVRRLD